MGFVLGLGCDAWVVVGGGEECLGAGAEWVVVAGGGEVWVIEGAAEDRLACGVVAAGTAGLAWRGAGRLKRRALGLACPRRARGAWRCFAAGGATVAWTGAVAAGVEDEEDAAPQPAARTEAISSPAVTESRRLVRTLPA